MAFSATTNGAEIVAAFPAAVAGKTILITGPSIGSIGSETAITLAGAPIPPAHILLAGRTISKIQPVIDAITAANPSIKTTFIALDLADLESVRKAASEIASAAPKLDILINNAGIMAVKDYTVTAQGIESQFGVNWLGHFLLTGLLIKAGVVVKGETRIVNLTSMGFEIEGIRFDDYNFKEGATYNPWIAYGQSKTGNVLHAVGLTTRGFTAHAVHPGLILDSHLLANVSQDMFADGFRIATEANGGVPVSPETPKTLQQGSSTTLVAALSPDVVAFSGTLVRDCNVVKPEDTKVHARDPALAEKLWALGEELTGEKFDF
ncbi:short-chain dehydrogenase [Sphaerosporella brunnea]|uniref:Short-chain dehydrogenase n=1 Tax=Sphaerosporella brunnea TaxID=1250544 RepID=A0A5J5F2Y3_9PEZI|nr:short-chain dehydrogenase [Sphaerosporella brunnea]